MTAPFQNSSDTAGRYQAGVSTSLHTCLCLVQLNPQVQWEQCGIDSNTPYLRKDAHEIRKSI